MQKTALRVSVILALCAACTSPKPTATPTTPIPPTVTPSGYHPVQPGDIVEGAKIGYEYILPSPEQPIVVIAFGEQMLELVGVKQELKAGLLAYIQELVQGPKSVYVFDEADPSQAEPQLMTLVANRPVEIVIIPLKSDSHTWSVTETEQGQVRAAYKLIRRQDGGLRFVDAYGIEAMNSFATLTTLNGGGAGLVYSARLALLRMILSDATYQRGVDVMASRPPAASQFDPRILKTDPSQTGLEQNVDWVLVSRPGPTPGLTAP